MDYTGLATPTNMGYVLNLGAFTIVGSFMGMSYETMGWGGVAGALVMALGEPPLIYGRAKGILSVAMSILMAGMFSEFVALWVAGKLELNQPPVNQAAVVLGGGWPWLRTHVIPEIWEAAKDTLRRWRGKNV